MISGVDALRDDPFPSRAACACQHRGAARARVAQPQRRVVGCGVEQRLEALAPLAPGTRGERRAAIAKEIEHHESRRRLHGNSRDLARILQVHARLQGLELARRRRLGSRSASARDDLAIEHHGVADIGGERPKRRDDLGKLRLLLLAVSRHQARVTRRDVGEHAHAVVLRLVRPPVIARERMPEGGVHGFRQRRACTGHGRQRPAIRVPDRMRPVRQGDASGPDTNARADGPGRSSIGCESGSPRTIECDQLVLVTSAACGPF